MAKLFSIILIFLVFTSCSIFNKNKKNNIEETNNCKTLMSKIEQELYLSCPISQEMNTILQNLEKRKEFVRNNEAQTSAGSIRFNFKNAYFKNYKLIDEKSLFLINYLTTEGKSKPVLFQAIYYFENKVDKDAAYNSIVDLLKNDLHLKPLTISDIKDNSYLRFQLPCGSGVNLKQGSSESDKHVINIL